MFRDWHALVPPSIGVVPIQLPGRGERLREPLLKRLDEVVQSARQAVLPLLDRRYALFGHSVGALIAFELASVLERENGRPPEHLFVAGRGSPDRPASRPPKHQLSRAEFVAALREFSPTLRGLLEDPEALDLFLPILRADLEISDTYVYRSRPPLSCPITAFGGTADDTVGADDLAGWRQHTRSGCTIEHFPGDHFFVTTAPWRVVRAIEGALHPAATRLPA